MSGRKLGQDDTSTTSLFLLGIGGVGSALAGQLAAESEALATFGTRLRLAGIANSRRMRLASGGLDPALGRSLLDDAAVLDLDAFSREVELFGGRRVVVDVTASAEVATLYPRWLDAGAAVVTANKLSLCGSMASFERLRRGRVYYETTAGAGLPVVGTLRSLVRTGDGVRLIEGVFSGTLGFLFHELRRGVPFDQALETARSRGYTEPDPNEDLSGKDVARKLVILARTAGFPVELDEIEVESLVGRTEGLEAREREERASGRRLCYLARFREGRGRVGLEAVEADHPAARVEGTDNVFLIGTDRYQDSPLVIQGSGAGPEVTAGGVFADILNACAEMN